MSIEHVNTLRIHEKKGRVKPIKVEKRDGSIEEIAPDALVEALTERARIEALTRDGLPECACCGEQITPERIRPRGAKSKLPLMCIDCPRCICGKPVLLGSMSLTKIRIRDGKRPSCQQCRSRRATRKAKERTPKQRAESARKASAARTPGQRSEIARKGGIARWSRKS